MSTNPFHIIEDVDSPLVRLWANVFPLVFLEYFLKSTSVFTSKDRGVFDWSSHERKCNIIKENIVENERVQSPRQVLHSESDVYRLNLFVNGRSGNIFYATADGTEHCTNRIKPESVWLDDDGRICAKVDRRKEK